MVEIANIREHCSWIHKDMEEATKKSGYPYESSRCKVNLNAPLQPGESRVTKRVHWLSAAVSQVFRQRLISQMPDMK